MEHLTEQETATSTIPGQIIQKLQNYSDYLDSVKTNAVGVNSRGAFIHYPADTAGLGVSERLAVLSPASGDTEIHRTYTGFLTNPSVRPRVLDIRIELSLLFTQKFRKVVTSLSRTISLYEASQNTTKGIETTTVSGPFSLAIKKQQALIPAPKTSTGHSLLKHATGWAGSDLAECLERVTSTRSKAKF